jgi:hypothetical protein
VGNNTNINNTLTLDDKSVATLNNFVGKFGEYVTQLSQFNLPSKIDIRGTYTMNVNLTGADAFDRMGVKLKQDIINIFQPQLDYIWKTTNGNLVRRSNRSVSNKEP